MSGYATCNDFYVSTPGADEFRDVTGTLVLTDAAGDAWTTAHSIIDGFVSDDVVTITAATPVEPSVTLATWEAELDEREDLQAQITRLIDENARYRHSLRESTKLLAVANETLAQRTSAFEQAEVDAYNARCTVGALHRTLTQKETEQFEEGLRHLLVAETSERDIEDLESDNKALQADMAKQRVEFTARYTAARKQIDALLTTIANAGVDHATLVADVHTQIGIMLEAGKIEADFHRNRNAVERNKQTIFRSKQIAAEHALSGRAMICAAFARSPELPAVPKMTVDEKLALANLQSMAD